MLQGRRHCRRLLARRCLTALCRPMVKVVEVRDIFILVAWQVALALSRPWLARLWLMVQALCRPLQAGLQLVASALGRPLVQKDDKQALCRPMERYLMVVLDLFKLA